MVRRAQCRQEQSRAGDGRPSYGFGWKLLGIDGSVLEGSVFSVRGLVAAFFMLTKASCRDLNESPREVIRATADEYTMPSVLC